jgi:hypothetical protein
VRDSAIRVICLKHIDKSHGSNVSRLASQMSTKDHCANQRPEINSHWIWILSGYLLQIYSQVTATHVYVYAPMTAHKDPSSHKQVPVCLKDSSFSSDAEFLLHYTEVPEVWSLLEVQIIIIVQVSFATAPRPLYLISRQDHAAHIVWILVWRELTRTFSNQW